MVGNQVATKTREARHGGGWRGARRRWVFSNGKKLRKRLTRFLAKQSNVGDPIVFDNADFPWTQALEREWKTIREELDTVLEYRRKLPPFETISSDQGGIAKEHKWKVFLLFGMGQRSPRNCELCPETVRLLESIPRLNSAFFSILSPRYHIPKHRGVTKGMIRCHVGLVIPKERESCYMQLKQERVVWEEGRAVVFDDMCKHEVRNDTDEERVVLLLDFERPMRPMVQLTSRLFDWALRQTAYFKDARRNQLEWERRFHDELDRVRTGSALAEG